MICRYCKSNRVVNYGKRNTMKKGSVQRYLCKSCNHCFTPNKGFLYVRYPPEVVASSLDLFYKGLSCRKVSDHFREFYKLNISHTTIFSWVQKYSRLVSKYTSSIKLKVGDTWIADETCLDGKNKEKWLWLAMDKDSKMIVGCMLTRTRIRPKEHLLLKAQRSYGSPKILKTDGYIAYRKMAADIGADHVKKTGRRVGNKKVNPWVADIERLNSSVKERTKVMRGVKIIRSGSVLMKGWCDYYNFVRPHSSLGGRTPAEACGIKINPEANKWLELIKRSSR